MPSIHSKAIPTDGDNISTQIIDKIFASSRVRLNEAQIQSFEHMLRFAFQKIIENNKICSCRVGDELILFQFERLFSEKPFQIESNGTRHKLTSNECLDREGTYMSPFYIGLSIWVFSRKDPRSKEKKLQLISRMKNKIRIASKAKRIR